MTLEHVLGISRERYAYDAQEKGGSEFVQKKPPPPSFSGMFYFLSKLISKVGFCQISDKFDRNIKIFSKILSDI